MPALPPALDKLATLLARLPGVGKRSAMRYAFFVLNEGRSYANALAQALNDVDQHVVLCTQCHTVTDEAICGICADPLRDQGLLCVLERVQDLLAIERTGTYRGLYHVLHGVLSPLKGIGPEQLRLGNLEQRLEALEVDEVIIATSTDVEGEATALYLAKRLQKRSIKVSRIATGIPMGGELEYLDQSTLGRALQARTPLNP